MILLENDDELLDKMNSREIIEYMISTILICVLELEDDLYPESTIKLSKEIKKEIKKNIKLASRQLFIADILILGDIYKRKLIDDENLNRRFDFIEKKELIDSLRYLTVAVVKLQGNILQITDEAEERVKPILKSAYEYINNINPLYNK